MADSGRTTLMGVPSPMAGQPEKPTTSPGHDVHLPTQNPRAADKRPLGDTGVPRTVEPDPASSRRGGVSAPAKSSGESASQQGSENSAKSDFSGKHGPDGQSGQRGRDSKAGPVVANERTMASAAATFRASAAGGNKQPEHEIGREPERSWTADRTQEFHLDPPPSVQSAFGKTLAVAIAIAAGTGILVVGFIHSRVRGGFADPSESARAAGPLPLAPVPLPPPPLPENPVPPVAVEPANEVPRPAEPEAPAAQALPEPAPPANETADVPDDVGKTERRLPGHSRTPAPAGRTAPPARTPRVSPPGARPGVASLPGAAPSPTAQAPAAGPPTTPPPLTPPPLTPERPSVRPEPARPEGAKPYDPDMPLPPSME